MPSQSNSPASPTSSEATRKSELAKWEGTAHEWPNSAQSSNRLDSDVVASLLRTADLAFPPGLHLGCPGAGLNHAAENRVEKRCGDTMASREVDGDIELTSESRERHTPLCWWERQRTRHGMGTTVGECRVDRTPE